LEGVVFFVRAFEHHYPSLSECIYRVLKHFLYETFSTFSVFLGQATGFGNEVFPVAL